MLFNEVWLGSGKATRFRYAPQPNFAVKGAPEVLRCPFLGVRRSLNRTQSNSLDNIQTMYKYLLYSTLAFNLVLYAGCANVKSIAPTQEQSPTVAPSALPTAPKAETKEGEQETTDLIHDECFRYTYGQGRPLDYKQAALWCQKSAELKVPSGITLLAELTYHGNGVPKDLTRARELYKQAAELGHNHARCMAAVMLWNGEGGPEDRHKAREYVDKAESEGYERALPIKKEMDQAIQFKNSQKKLPLKRK